MTIVLLAQRKKTIAYDSEKSSYMIMKFTSNGDPVELLGSCFQKNIAIRNFSHISKQYCRNFLDVHFPHFLILLNADMIVINQ